MGGTLLKLSIAFGLLIDCLATSTDAMARTASLSVSGASLIFTGPGLQAPDAEGHFAIGIRLPQRQIAATGCETPYLIVGMGTLNKPENELTAAERAIVQRNVGYWRQLVGESQRGAPVEIPVRNDDHYLKLVRDKVVAPYCTLSIDEEKVP